MAIRVYNLHAAVVGPLPEDRLRDLAIVKSSRTEICIPRLTANLKSVCESQPSNISWDFGVLSTGILKSH